MIKYKTNLSKDILYEYIDKISKLNILIIGETIIDEYQYGHTIGKAGKSPIVAFQNEKLERYSGGVSAIKYHLKDFCNVSVSTDSIVIVKKRYIQNGQKLFETYDGEEIEYGYSLDNYEDYDLIIVADFGHGFITKEMREDIVNSNKFIALNTQLNAFNSGLNTINKYSRANYITLSELELRLAFSNQFDSIDDILKENIKKNLTISITKGKNGCIVYRNGDIIKVPSFITNVKDSIGAGDAFLSLTSPLAYLNAPIEVIGFLGNIAGAITCTYMGNKYHINKKLVNEYIEKLL